MVKKLRSLRNRLFAGSLLLGVFARLRSEYEKKTFKIVHYRIASKKIRHTVCFLFLSDLHDNEFGREQKELLSAMEKLNPDFVLIGGDFPVAGKKTTDIAKTISICREIASRFPTIYANGNHELRLRGCPDRYKDAYNRLHQALLKMGVKHLQDESVSPAEGIRVSGLDIESRYYTKRVWPNLDGAYITKRLGKSSENDFEILLAHSPNFLQAYSDWGADLALSGHFHGGTIRLGYDIGLMTPQLQLFHPFVNGMKRLKKTRMIISAGLGTHSVNLRLNNYPELIFVTLEPEELT